METFTLVPRGPFSLAAGIRFLEGFAPAAYTGPDSPGPAESGPEDVALELAFPVERSWQTVGVRVSQGGSDVTAAIVSPKSPPPELTAAVRPQVERILSLDVDGADFPAVGERDPVVGDLQRRYPGLRPVGFWSPYEAAAWAIIGHRIRVSQAAAIKARIAKLLGEPVTFGDRAVHAFPCPQRLAELDTFPGLSGRKTELLRSIARAAACGQLDAARLRGLPRETALNELKKLPGIGDFSATLILLRGAGDPDAVPGREPRLARAVALAYGLPEPATPGQLLQISENWKPYRTWVTLLMRTRLENETGEITGRRGSREALSSSQHVVASRVPPAPARTGHNQGAWDWTERRRDPDPRSPLGPIGANGLGRQGPDPGNT